MEERVKMKGRCVEEVSLCEMRAQTRTRQEKEE